MSETTTVTTHASAAVSLPAGSVPIAPSAAGRLADAPPLAPGSGCAMPPLLRGGASGAAAGPASARGVLWRRASALVLVLVGALVVALVVASVAGLCGGVSARAGAEAAGGASAVWCAGAVAGCGQRVAAGVLGRAGVPGVGGNGAASDCHAGSPVWCDEILGEWDSVTPPTSRA